MSQELNRNFAVLKDKADPAPYFLSYEITEQDYRTVSGTLGTIDSTASGKARSLDVSIRVGDHKLDNYHRVRGDRGQVTCGATISFEDSITSIKRRIWLETDRAYRAAAERLIRIRTNTQVKVAQEDNSDDFSVEPPVTAVETLPKLRFDESALAGEDPPLLGALRQLPERPDQPRHRVRPDRYPLLRQHRRLAHRPRPRLCPDRDHCQRQGVRRYRPFTFETFEAVDESGLPDDKTVLAAIDRVANDVSKLLKAPEAEPFVGPAIFSGRAAGVFFHEIFGHRVEGHRQKDESEGQTFTKSISTKVLPDFLSVVFDPTRRKVGDVDLNGWFDYDDEGVKAPVGARGG